MNPESISGNPFPECTGAESGVQHLETGIYSVEFRVQNCSGLPYMGQSDVILGGDRCCVNCNLESSERIKSKVLLLYGVVVRGGRYPVSSSLHL